MSTTFGSGQTNGAPLLVTAITSGTAQTLHTAVSGSGTPDLVTIEAVNSDSANNQTLHLVVGGQQIDIVLPRSSTYVYPTTFPLNNGKLVSVWADTASVISVTAQVSNQTAASSTSYTEKNTALTTAGAGTITAAMIWGGVVSRSGPVAAFTDTTDTAAAIIAAMSNAAVGQSFEMTYVNTTAFVATLAGGTGVTVTALGSGTLTVPANSWAQFLVSYASAGAVSVQGMTSGLNSVLPPAKFTTVSVTTGTLTAGQASGAAFVCLTSTGNTPGNQAMRTVAQVLVDTPGLAVGMSYMLRITQTGTGTFTLTTDSGTQFTMVGTMTIAQNTFRDFCVTINTATTGTVQSVATGTFG